MDDKLKPAKNDEGISETGPSTAKAGTSPAVVENPDREFDVAISNILRGGVTISTLVVTVGVVMHLTHHSGEPPQYHYFHGQPQLLTTIQGIVSLAIAGNGDGVMQSGVVLLLLTPIIRVAFSLLAFFKQRDWIYVAVALIVLSVLIYSLMGGKAGGA